MFGSELSEHGPHKLKLGDITNCRGGCLLRPPLPNSLRGIVRAQKTVQPAHPASHIAIPPHGLSSNAPLLCTHRVRTRKRWVYVDTAR